MSARLLKWLLGGVFLCLMATLGCHSASNKGASAPEVVLAPVEQRDVPQYIEWIGTTRGFNNAVIRPQVKGYLRGIDYRQGAVVDQDQLLFQIDPREFEAELENARGELGQAKANLEKSEIHVKRYRPLAKDGAVSQQELDDAEQNALADKARVLSAEARLAQAELNLSWAKIKSPIRGVADIAVAQIGDLVSQGTELTTVSQLDPIKVSFAISQQDYLMLARARKSEDDGRSLESAGAILQLYLADGSLWPHAGTPFILGRAVDRETGTITIEGRFDNPGNVLRPGQFARVRVHVGDLPNALLVPQRAVSDVQGQYLISVVGKDDVVDIRNVQVGMVDGKNWVITKGLSKGEQVIVEGLQKVKAGMKVRPVAAQQTKQGKPASSGETAKPAAQAG
ncbi:MAG: hypothetical protein CBC48_12805 [bacterium TMED88]|nr:efflux transporter periplasmic adaptor subunit [Deltaproteobacteria bacterium]OUV28619.1 MAG: hypothetical protein CBC48_12805 [bacterium TMED88]